MYLEVAVEASARTVALCFRESMLVPARLPSPTTTTCPATSAVDLVSEPTSCLREAARAARRPEIDASRWCFFAGCLCEEVPAILVWPARRERLPKKRSEVQSAQCRDGKSIDIRSE